MMKKIIISLIVLFVLITAYLSFFPKIVVENVELEKEIPIKIFPQRDFSDNGNDSLLVYLPYKVRVVNYSTSFLKRINYYFRDIDYNHHPQYMIYNNEENLYYKDGSLNEEAINRAMRLLPLIPKTFYVYKYNIIPAKKVNVKIDSIMYEKLAKEFISTKENLLKKSSITIPKNIIDSLYKIENNKYMYFNFLSKPLWKFKLKPSEKKGEFQNLYGLPSEEIYRRLSQPIE